MNVLYPPRPKGRILPTQLGGYEKTGKWLVQRKFNGTRILLNVKGGKIGILNRHGEPPKLFSLSATHRAEILSLNLDPAKEYWFDGELLDHKTITPAFKGRIVLFDILQAGDYFFGSPNLEDRYDLLKNICRNPTDLEPNLGIALQATPNIWLAQNFYENFESRFQDFLEHPEIEGCVLKQKKSCIDNLGKKEYEVGWQIRCRKPHKNYNF